MTTPRNPTQLIDDTFSRALTYLNVLELLRARVSRSKNALVYHELSERLPLTKEEKTPQLSTELSTTEKEEVNEKSRQAGVRRALNDLKVHLPLRWHFRHYTDGNESFTEVRTEYLGLYAKISAIRDMRTLANTTGYFYSNNPFTAILVDTQPGFQGGAQRYSQSFLANRSTTFAINIDNDTAMIVDKLSSDYFGYSAKQYFKKFVRAPGIEALIFIGDIISGRRKITATKVYPRFLFKLDEPSRYIYGSCTRVSESNYPNKIEVKDGYGEWKSVPIAAQEKTGSCTTLFDFKDHPDYKKMYVAHCTEPESHQHEPSYLTTTQDEKIALKDHPISHEALMKMGITVELQPTPIDRLVLKNPMLQHSTSVVAKLAEDPQFTDQVGMFSVVMSTPGVIPKPAPLVKEEKASIYPAEWIAAEITAFCARESTREQTFNTTSTQRIAPGYLMTAAIPASLEGIAYYDIQLNGRPNTYYFVAIRSLENARPRTHVKLIEIGREGKAMLGLALSIQVALDSKSIEQNGCEVIAFPLIQQMNLPQKSADHDVLLPWHCMQTLQSARNAFRKKPFGIVSSLTPGHYYIQLDEGRCCRIVPTAIQVRDLKTAVTECKNALLDTKDGVHSRARLFYQSKMQASDNKSEATAAKDTFIPSLRFDATEVVQQKKNDTNIFTAVFYFRSQQKQRCSASCQIHGNGAFGLVIDS